MQWPGALHLADVAELGADVGPDVVVDGAPHMQEGHVDRARLRHSVMAWVRDPVLFGIVEILFGTGTAASVRVPKSVGTSAEARASLSRLHACVARVMMYNTCLVSTPDST